MNTLDALDERIRQAEADVRIAEAQLRGCRQERQQFFDDNLRCESTEEFEVSAGRRSYFETFRCKHAKHDATQKHNSENYTW